jgi:hypothetical protein
MWKPSLIKPVSIPLGYSFRNCFYKGPSLYYMKYLGVLCVLCGKIALSSGFESILVLKMKEEPEGSSFMILIEANNYSAVS